MIFRSATKEYYDPETMAQEYLRCYFDNTKIEYPINPFKMLKDEGVLFSLNNFKKLEGVYIPANTKDDIALVGININRPITRQRFTAAHELCHHFKDADKQVSCPIGTSKNQTEKFAEQFAAALLMPIDELQSQVNIRRNENANISFDDVLEIACYFGVSFESCLYRIAYRIHAISGNTEIEELRKRIREYEPDNKRKSKHITYANLFASLIDCYQEQLSFSPSDYARYVFQNSYIYNDSRMEGLDVTIEEASEIVTDLRLNMQNSKYCNETNEAYLSIAGHYKMYQDILEFPIKNKLTVYELFDLNKSLFSYYPYPEFGGQTRQSNTLVLGAKFETVDYINIYSELAKVDEEVKNYYENIKNISMSEYIMHVARVHHRITQIHPFSEGNGRTSRAFMNIQLVRASMLPIYIKVEDKDDYLNALSIADKDGLYDELYEIIFKLILTSYNELILHIE